MICQFKYFYCPFRQLNLRRLEQNFKSLHLKSIFNRPFVFDYISLNFGFLADGGAFN